MADDSMVLEDDSQPLGITAPTSSSRKVAPALVTQDGVIGYVRDGEPFQPRTKFTVEVVGCLKMEGYIVGYLFSITRNDDDTARLVFFKLLLTEVCQNVPTEKPHGRTGVEIIIFNTIISVEQALVLERILFVLPKVVSNISTFPSVTPSFKIAKTSPVDQNDQRCPCSLLSRVIAGDNIVAGKLPEIKNLQNGCVILDFREICYAERYAKTQLQSKFELRPP